MTVEVFTEDVDDGAARGKRGAYRAATCAVLCGLPRESAGGGKGGGELR